MIKIYLRQALTLIKQNKLYSFIYIMGTGLSVALIMIVFIIYYIKFAPIYPENNRNNTLVFKCIDKIDNQDSNNSGNLSYSLCSKVLGNIKGVKDIAIEGRFSNSGSGYVINMPKGKDNITVDLTHTNGGFWKVFTFNFISGKPYTEADLEANNKCAVICESIAKAVYGSANVAGRELTINGDRYKISGVVKDVSAAMSATYSEVWTTTSKEAMKSPDEDNLLGRYSCYMTINENSTKDAVRSEIQSYFKRLNNTNKNFKVNIMNQPDDYWQSTFRYWTNEGPNIKEIITDFLIMMFALLFVPALNLCGLISSRMENRLCEMGIRKTFGARKNSLILQVVCENLALTAIGAVAGLLLSYIVVLISSDWILNIFSDGGAINTHITFNMLFNPIIIGIAIVTCMILNLLSAVIPATLSLRHNIIYSLNTKR